MQNYRYSSRNHFHVLIDIPKLKNGQVSLMWPFCQSVFGEKLSIKYKELVGLLLCPLARIQAFRLRVTVPRPVMHSSSQRQ